MIKLNRRVIIRAWTSEPNQVGSPVPVEVGAWEIWAQIEDRSGSNYAPAEQTIWNYDYRVTMRAEASRVIGVNYTIDYDNKRLKIETIKNLTEAFRHYIECRCSTVEGYVASAPGGSVLPLPQIGTYKYTAGSVTDSFAVAELEGKQIIAAYKDGVKFAIVTTTPDPAEKEVKITAGVFYWSVPFTPGEVAEIQYIQ